MGIAQHLIYVKMLGSLYHGKDGNVLRNNPGFGGEFGPKFNDERRSSSSGDDDNDNEVEEPSNVTVDVGRDFDDNSGNICRSLDINEENATKSAVVVVLL